MQSNFCFIFVFLSLLNFTAVAQIVNPLDYGLIEAKTGVDRYEALLKCHSYAIRQGAKVSYAGISKIELEIPDKFSSIPLTYNTDFSGCTIVVTNIWKKVCLFSLSSEIIPIQVSAKSIDNADYRSIEPLSKGTYLLVITDKNSWVDRRIGHDYGHNRKDVVLVKDGKGTSKPIMSYNNSYSKHVCAFRRVSEREKLFCNLHFVRSEKSTAITTLVNVENENNVSFRNITVVTPQGSGLKADRLFRITNCTNVAFYDVKVDGTYSTEKDSGYAFYLNNVWNHTATNMEANGAWGVYGTNDVNKTVLNNCKLNRFDIHCYGRDVMAIDCIFNNLYNQFGSVFGKIEYKSCIFNNSVPFITGGSYKAFVGVDVEFTDCEFNISKNNFNIVNIMKLGARESLRHELKKKCLPNFTFINCSFNIDSCVKHWYFFNLGNTKNVAPLGYISDIKMKNVIFNGNADLILTKEKFETENPLKVSLKNVYKLSKGKKTKLNSILIK